MENLIFPLIQHHLLKDITELFNKSIYSCANTTLSIIIGLLLISGSTNYLFFFSNIFFTACHWDSHLYFKISLSFPILLLPPKKRSWNHIKLQSNQKKINFFTIISIYLYLLYFISVNFLEFPVQSSSFIYSQVFGVFARQHVTFLIVFSDCLWLVYRNTIDF